MQKILSRVMNIGFGIQIVLGILWMYNAFVGFTGPVEGIVCVGAMLITGASLLFFKQGLCGKGTALQDCFVVLSVQTFPFMMQSLIKPDYRLLMAVILTVCAGVAVRLLRKRQGVKVFLVMLGFWLTAGGFVVVLEGAAQGFAPVSTRLTERMAWTTLYKNYANLPEESRQVINYGKLTDSTYEVTGIEEILLPALEEELGKAEADRIMEELRAVAWTNNKGQILKETVWDIMGYAMSPVIVPLQIAGRAYESYTGMNYRELLQPSPKLGKFYAGYSCWWFVVALCAAVWMVAIDLIHKRRKIVGCNVVLVGLMNVGLIVGYALNGAGKMDYKNTLFVLVVWLVWMAAEAVRPHGAVVEQRGGNRDEEE